ncbi:MAG: FmdE family protein [Desulfurella sp.]|uniref:FmdE family protein n=1 Tax=Desulfurella sp. TaxID=1962857 RepID=UPI003D09866D
MNYKKEWLDYAKKFHGHICPYVALGVKASLLLLSKLNIKRASTEDTINENLLAIVECNNCFLDGVQIATGCTIGNNSLIYLDTGKNSLSIVRRSNFEGLRLYMDSDKVKGYFPKRGLKLFDKVVKQRNANQEEIKEMSALWEETGYKMLEIDNSIFDIKPIKIKPIERAPIFDSLKCDNCSELVMSTKIIEQNGKHYCATCANISMPALIGRGIQTIQSLFLEV